MFLLTGDTRDSFIFNWKIKLYRLKDVLTRLGAHLYGWRWPTSSVATGKNIELWGTCWNVLVWSMVLCPYSWQVSLWSYWAFLEWKIPKSAQWGKALGAPAHLVKKDFRCWTSSGKSFCVPREFLSVVYGGSTLPACVVEGRVPQSSLDRKGSRFPVSWKEEFLSPVDRKGSRFLVCGKKSSSFQYRQESNHGQYRVILCPV